MMSFRRSGACRVLGADPTVYVLSVAMETDKHKISPEKAFLICVHLCPSVVSTAFQVETANSGETKRPEAELRALVNETDSISLRKDVQGNVARRRHAYGGHSVLSLSRTQNAGSREGRGA